MRIAFASFRYFPYGGLEKDMLRMAECAAKRGHDVTIISGSWEDDSIPDIPGLDVEVLKVPGLSNHTRADNFCRRIIEVFRQKKFDCTIGFNRIPGCDFYFAADNCYAVEMPKKHSRSVLKIFPRYRTYLALEERVFRPGAGTKIFYIAERQKSDYISCYGTEEERFILLPPGMNPACRLLDDAESVRKEKRRELGVADGDFLLLLLGSNFRQKGGDRAIRAVAGLTPELKKRTKLILVGADTPDFCRKIAEKYAVADKVIFPGARKDVPELLTASDILLLPARNESAGSTIVEAISCGVPVICSAECGFAPYASAACGKVLSEPWSDELFSRAVEEIAENYHERKAHAVAHARTVDFTRRADEAVDALENFVRTKDAK